MGVEPMTSSLPRKCSTTELQQQLKSLSFNMLAFQQYLNFMLANSTLITFIIAHQYELRIKTFSSGQRRIRTSEVERQLSYSQPQLATLVSAQL